jgi:hypothetical protein
MLNAQSFQGYTVVISLTIVLVGDRILQTRKRLRYGELSQARPFIYFRNVASLLVGSHPRAIV